MKLFNEQFKQLLSCYPHDSNCKSALALLEQDSSTSTPSVSAQSTAPSDDWDAERVRKLIKGLRFRVRSRNAYFGHLLDKVNIVVVNPKSKTFRTMAVDGKGNLYINPLFVTKLITGLEPSVHNQAAIDANIAKDAHGANAYNSLPEGEKVFLGIIAHELMHIFKDHIARMGHRTRMISIGGSKGTLWNIATDIEINDELIYKWGYYLIKNGIITEPDGSIEFNGKKYECRGKSPERIYRMLADDIKEDPNSDQSNNDDPRDINVGDIIFDKKTGKYGEVTTIDANGVAKIGELTKEEAKARVKS